MNKSAVKKLLSGAVAGLLCVTAVPQIPKSSVFADSKQVKGKTDGYDLEMWSDYGEDEAEMEPGPNGTYTCSWNDAYSVIFKSGKKFGDSSRFPANSTNITVDFNVDYRPDGISSLMVYGWMKDPLVEYNIVESYGTWRPPGGGPNIEKHGNVMIDGAVYEVYESQRMGPSIEAGVDTFKQYWSVRDYSSRRTSGTVTTRAHFKAWENYGMKLGNLYEVTLSVDGFRSSGSATVKKNNLYISPMPHPDPDEEEDDIPYNPVEYTPTAGVWEGRGSAEISQDTDNYYSGGSSYFVTGRSETWNGAACYLDMTKTEAGSSYSFSSAVMQDTGSDVDIQMSLQYSLNGIINYEKIAGVKTKSSQWTDLSNTSFMIPQGASDCIVYFEEPDSVTDFYFDDFTIAESGTASKIKTGSGVVNGVGTTAVSSSVVRGDFDGDKKLDSFDLTLARELSIEQFAGSSDVIDMNVADLNGDGNFSVADVVCLAKYLSGESKAFAKPYTTTSATTTAPVITTTTTAVNALKSNTVNFMKQISDDMQISAPNDFTQKRGSVDYGKVEKVTYYSKDGKTNKSMNVILPAGYNTNEKYPVLYILHGIGGNEQSMLDMGVQTMLGNLIADGKCEKMIIVCPAMLTGQGGGGFGFDQETMRKYDLIREDIENSIMPYMEANYSIKTGRENTAITGFSLGGRESLYAGITHSQYYGYVGAACAAPGIFPTTDMYMTHEGSLKQTGEFKPAVMPEMILMSAAANDGVVAVTENYPDTYHKALQSNGVEHLWQVIPNGDHGQMTVSPHLYNFLRYVFKA